VNRLLAFLVWEVLLIGCQPGELPAVVSPSESSSIEPSGLSASAPPGGECAPAPTWLISRLEHLLIVPGATLSRIFTLPAADLSTADGEGIGAVSSPVWVAAFVNGAGVRPQLATWLVSTLDEQAAGEVWAADVNAHRYSDASWLGGPITGVGFADVRRCAGPVPEP
jgi:hypothetical protein